MRNIAIAIFLVGAVIGFYFVLATTNVVAMVIVALLILIPIAIAKAKGKLDNKNDEQSGTN